MRSTGKKQSFRSESTVGVIGEICPVLQSSRVETCECVLEPILDDLPVGVVIVNSEGRFTVFNSEAKRILGMGPKQVGPHAWAETYGCYLPDKVTLYRSEDMPLARALRGELVPDELMFVRNASQPNGVWIRTICRQLSNIAGEHGWAVAVFTDVTERRKAIERIELLSRAVEQTADTVVITDEDGVITYVNPAFELTTGYRREEAVGSTPRILKSGMHDPDFYKQLWATILDGNPYRGTLRNRKKDGTLYWAEQTITPITGDGRTITHFVSVLKDMTESRAQQEQQIQMRIAREVQQRFYGHTVSVPGLDIGTAVYPAEQTGGDYIDLIPGPNDSLCVAIGDVSGHGFGAALVMALMRAYVRSFCAQRMGVAKILRAMNRMLLTDLEENRYVTLLLVHIDPADGLVSYASAGHVPGFILNRAGEVEAVLESTGIPLGLLEHRRFGTKLTPLQPGQVMVLATDGVTEAGEPEQFGSQRLLACVRDHRRESAQQIAHGVYRAVRAFAAEQPQQDDIALIIVKAE